MLQSSSHPCIFYSKIEPKLVLALWVDDGLAMCHDKALLLQMIFNLKTTFEITMGNVDVYVGLHNTRDKFRKKLLIDQQRFTKTL